MNRKIFSLALAVLMLAGLGLVFIPAQANTPNYGDVDGNGVINSADVTLLRRRVAQGNENNLPSNYNRANADVNGDGVINATDVTLLRRYVAATDPSTVILGPMKLVSLTFDDGPHIDHTRDILNYLDTLNTHATLPKVWVTFYINGYNWWGNTNPGSLQWNLMQRAHNAGHAIENHTWSHGDQTGLQTWSPSEIRSELTQLNTLITNVTGKYPFSLRPPQFRHGPNALGIDREFNLPYIFAGVDTDDWRGEHTPAHMADFILNGAKPCQWHGQWGCSTATSRMPNGTDLFVGARGNNNNGADGANILMHDGGGIRTRTVDSLPLFIPTMRDLGYEFVTVEQHYRRKNITPCWYSGARINDWIVPAGTPGGCNHTPRCAPV